MRKLLKKQGFAPKLLVTDKLGSTARRSGNCASPALEIDPEGPFTLTLRCKAQSADQFRKSLILGGGRFQRLANYLLGRAVYPLRRNQLLLRCLGE
jgi:hypothetical protein